MDTCQKLVEQLRKVTEEYLLYNSIFKIMKTNNKLITNCIIYFFKHNKSNLKNLKP